MDSKKGTDQQQHAQAKPAAAPRLSPSKGQVLTLEGQSPSAVQLKGKIETVQNSPRTSQLKAQKAFIEGSSKMQEVRQLAAIAAPKNVVQRATTKVDGKITYKTQDFKYKTEKKKRERAAEAVITGINKKNEFPPNEPISFMSMDTGKWDDMDGYHRGHVAARQFGGAHFSYNIVPMLPNFNTGGWANVETAIGAELGKGHTVTINPNYNSTSDERIPSSMSMKSSGGASKTIAHAVPSRKPLTDSENKDIKKSFSNKKDKAYALAELAKAAKQKIIPPNYLNSPYLILDVHWLSGAGYGSPMSRKAYQGWQIDWLIRYNMRLNGGNIESDAWAKIPPKNRKEPHRILSEAGRKDRPEIDHIIPNSSGGANFFTNARVVSWELNNSIERVVPASQKQLKW